MTIKELVSNAHENAVAHGFWENQVPFSESIALIHAEASEALEEVRAGRGMIYFHVDKDGNPKPEGYGVELADIVIRVADLCGAMGINLDDMLRLKMEYNKSRPYKHGKKF